MRVDWLYLKDYKNLKEFEVDFDVSSERQVVVGRNGVGKSNVLEALAWIFRDLDLEEDSGFEYKIRYKCNGAYLKIETKSGKRTKGKVTAFPRKYFWADKWGKDEEPGEEDYRELKETEFYRKNKPIDKDGENILNPDRLLPAYVFGYYSGVSGRFNEAFKKHEERYYKDQASGEEAAFRSMFLAKPHHSQFSLLSFFASKEEETKQFLLDEFSIEKLQSVLFLLQEPYWYSSRRKRLETEKADRRFWGSAGKVAPFLDKLFENSLAPMPGSERKEVSIGRTKTVEKRYCFIKDQDAFDNLASNLEPQEFFSRLESSIFTDLLGLDGEDLKIRVKLNDSEHPITFKEMSEGEQQLLTIIGLMRFTAQSESLFLLDEPDTHLNPAWCLDLLDNLRTYGVNPKNSQLIITTHNPLTFAGLDENEVVIMDRRSDGSIHAEHPINPPKGMGFQAILTSDFFRLRSTLDKETLAKLDEKRELALNDKKTDADRARLAALDHELGRLDFSHAARDPLYLEYIRAMTEQQNKNPDISSAAPSAVDWEKRKRLAERIAQRLSEREAQE
ncbi:MAG: AAA family ATPase [Porticoccaceae bacterium]|nr:AAA family ATPase [Porticoccaceae bacterium]